MTARACGPDLSELSVMVVEDEMLLALEYESMLDAMGCSVLGPAPSEVRALELLDREWPDVAILDLNLHGEPPTALAEKLRMIGIPFGIVTGYVRPHLADGAFAEAPRLLKPIVPVELAGLLRELAAN